MLAGVNTHIDLDLEITAQNIAPALTLPKLHGDFNTINAALAIQINGVVEQSPLFTRRRQPRCVGLQPPAPCRCRLA